MAMVVPFPQKANTVANLNEKKSGFNLFNKLSQRLGVDVDKIVLERDQTEKAKLERVLHKQTLKDRTRSIEE
ncbi:hypothetical protein [Ectobacillus antri]|uniref:hypothetical protein n=1 Tax=Ectobacillus antri TaxID=2486280 RepID=UPI000F59EA4E|nr:hypothetical protein [Ectobacillus antri]